LSVTVLYESERTLVSRVQTPSETLIRKETRGARAAMRRRHELAILHRLAEIAGIPRILKESDDQGAILLEDAGGSSLAERPDTGPMPVQALLALAEDLVGIIAAVHRQGVIHKDINPANVVLSGTTGRPLLIDFDLATTFALERPAFTQVQDIVGTLAYLAPEQTGRTGWAVDQRADLYALGATLYELATGAPPFGHGDLLDLVHDHLTREPRPPSERNPLVPQDLSRIILHLLEKEPSRRYQSAEGVLQDLRRLRLALAGGEDQGFALGERDFPLRLTPPSHLVGRAQEIESLHAALNAAVEGRCRGLLVSGPPGVGKTALIDELRAMVTAAGGWLVSGKYDQYRQDAGADALLQALRGLGRLLLAEPEEALSKARPRLREFLGGNAGLLMAMAPELADVLDVSAEADDDPLRMQVRLQQAALAVLRALAGSSRPIVIFLDDLQWAGPVLIGFMDAVMDDRGLRGVLLVGSYRESEVGATHPLAAVLHRWRGLSEPPQHLRLTNLPATDLWRLLADMLRLPEPAAARLAEAIHPCTQGNPFDTVELVNALRRDGVLLPSADGWTWDAAAVRQHIRSADVATRLTQRIEALPEPARESLRLVACLGGEVELRLLQAATGATPIGTDAAAAQVEAALTPALEDGLLVMEQRATGSVRFRHDRIQQATYGGLGTAERRALHLSIARRLAALPELAVIAAEHYLEALEDLTDPSERQRAAQLLRQAGRNARSLANYALAERLLGAAVDLIDPTAGPLHTRDRLRLELMIERHGALLGLGRFEELDRLYSVIAAVCDDPLLLAEAVCPQMSSLLQRARPADAMSLGLGVLARLGHPAPDGEALFAEIGRGLQALQSWVSSGSAEDDVRRGESTDLRDRATAKVILKLIPAAFFCGSPVMPWLVTASARLWAEGGPLPGLVGALAHASFVTVALQGDYRTGYAVVDRVLAVSTALGYEPETSLARTLRGISAAHWLQPLDECLREIRRGREGLVRGGELMHAGLSFYGSVGAALECSPTLDDVLVEIEACADFTAKSGDRQVGEFAVAYRQAVRALRGETSAVDDLDDGLDIEAHRAALKTNPTAAANDHLLRARNAATAGSLRGLAEHAAAAYGLIALYETSYASLLSRFLQGLSFARQAAQAPPAERAGLLAELEPYRVWLAARAAEAPANFSHLLALLEAERAAAVGDVEAASRAYDKAQHEVAHRQRPWDRAFIAECSGRFYLVEGMEHAGRAALHAARRFYHAWGAAGKVAQMERELPFLKAQAAEPFGEVKASRQGATTTRTTLDLSAHAVDLLAVLRASQALSSETSLPRLQERFADLICGLTGATSARMLLRDPDQDCWYLPHQDGQERLTITPATAASLVPLSVLRYVERTQEPLLIDDATRDDRFAQDAYVSALDACALLVVPLRTRDQVSAMLLLENRNSRAAFGINRLDTVRLIAGQLSVSLDNARLYADLERKVAERTQALQTAKDELERLAVTDALTGLANRRRLTETLDGEWLRATRPGSSIAIAMIDIDEFKRYNDHYGHLAGDRCLCKAAAAMQRTIRATDLVARYGGEEFAVVMPDADLVLAEQIAERIRVEIASLAEPHLLAKNRIVTVSIGAAAAVPTATTTGEQLLKAADDALYEAKRAGRNRVTIAPLSRS
jgi:diguanylate cyclase (GGDEF)-like protein